MARMNWATIGDTIIIFLCVFQNSHAGCTHALGMEAGLIKDLQITASSHYSQFAKPAFARLNNKPDLSSTGAWCADDYDQNPYLQIDLLTPHTITKLATQGTNANLIQKYSLSFSYDNNIWFDYTVNGKVKTFVGNRNAKRIVWRNLTQPLTARVLRIHPILVDKKILACARVELYGCEPSEDCNTAVGVEDGRITDQQMTASSYLTKRYASNGRINEKFSEKSYGAWCTDKKDLHQYLQIDLGRVRSVSGVATQGGSFSGMFVKQYKLNYSTDGSTWQSYRERPGGDSKTFQGNWDNITVIKKMFRRRIFARFIRFNPISWNQVGDICMRVEIFECLSTEGSVPRVSPPSETVELNRTSSVNLTCFVSGQPGVHMEWYKNRVQIPAPPLSQIHRTKYANGSVKSVFTLNRVKYKDRGSIISCAAWYPTLSINSTRNIHLLVHAPRPDMVISEVQSRQVRLHVTDPTPADTKKYLVRYKTDTEHSQWVSQEQRKTSQSEDVWITLLGVHPCTAYMVQVASYYKDHDEGPYSVPKRFTTKQAGCTHALGMEAGLIKDVQITTSSYRSAFLKPAFARLNNKPDSNSFGAWCADRYDQNPYLQIDLLTPHTITKLATQGGDVGNYIQKYTLSFSYNNNSWFNYTVNGKVKIFVGNRNAIRTVWRNLAQPLTARALRIHPILVDKKVSTCARVELYGCEPSEGCPRPAQISSTSRTMTSPHQILSGTPHITAATKMNTFTRHDNELVSNRVWELYSSGVINTARFTVWITVLVGWLFMRTLFFFYKNV